MKESAPKNQNQVKFSYFLLLGAACTQQTSKEERGEEEESCRDARHTE
jgi:hypothetical protein